MITDSQIKAAIRRVKGGTSRVELRDQGVRGSGRLTLIVRGIKARTICEWYALYYRGGKRCLTKICAYPILSLVEARKRCQEEYAPTILAGARPENRFARSLHRRKLDISVRSLFVAYDRKRHPLN